jgi:uncharacterized membrane protein YecN with MAPEG domain
MPATASRTTAITSKWSPRRLLVRGRRRIYHPAVRRRPLALLLVCLLALAMAAVASAYVIGATPLIAARAATKKHAAHEVVAWNRPGVSYTMGTCRVLHRKPYLAFECGWKLHGVPDYCQGRLVIAVRKLTDTRWRATGIKSFYIDNRGC